MIYLDASYLVRLYYKDHGYEAVRALAATAPIACALHGRAEVVSALHRKFRDGNITPALYTTALQEFSYENRAEAFRWLPLSHTIFDRLDRIYSSLPANIFLRSGDAIHLACAAENGFNEIYSNDQHLLAAARHFRLKGLNVI